LREVKWVILGMQLEAPYGAMEQARWQRDERALPFKLDKGRGFRPKEERRDGPFIEYHFACGEKLLRLAVCPGGVHRFFCPHIGLLPESCAGKAGSPMGPFMAVGRELGWVGLRKTNVDRLDERNAGVKPPLNEER
jgi:hypothetical protein